MFGEGFDRFFLGLLNTGFAASVVILIVLLLRLVLRRAPKRYLYLLWAPALLRLLCPFSLESALSLLPANPTLFRTISPRWKLLVWTPLCSAE